VEARILDPLADWWPIPQPVSRSSIVIWVIVRRSPALRGDKMDEVGVAVTVAGKGVGLALGAGGSVSVGAIVKVGVGSGRFGVGASTFWGAASPSGRAGISLPGRLQPPRRRVNKNKRVNRSMSKVSF